MSDMGADFVDSNTALLAFRNFVGAADILGVKLAVLSKKLPENGVSQLLADINRISSSLVFGWNSPITFEATTAKSVARPVPYHQMLFLRQEVLQKPVGQRLTDVLDAIERNPTRAFLRQRRFVRPGEVARIDAGTMRQAFSRMERMVPLGSPAALARNPIAQALTFGNPPKPHFPSIFDVPTEELTFDTPENRFVKHVLTQCLHLAYRFAPHPKLHESLRSDCRKIVSLLEQQLRGAHFDGVGSLTGFSSPSQTLQKAEGYREIFLFWNHFSQCAALPKTEAEVSRFLDGRDIATLYEYWVFSKILEIVAAVSGKTIVRTFEVSQNELGAGLSYGLEVHFEEEISVTYNKTYSRPRGTAYSTPLRPDVIVSVRGQEYAFDAKYRLTILDVDESTDDGALTYKRADIYKMHTYCDAIPSIKASFVVYPGNDFIFFSRAGGVLTEVPPRVALDGVGAIPVRPSIADSQRQLSDILTAIVSR